MMISETAAAVVVNGRDLRSNVISSQIALHTLYGGVVPEIASRKHIEKINQVIEQALSDAQMTLDDIDAIGVTYGPGLVGALLVGVAEAKAIAYARNLPLVGVHHIEGHISANYIENKDLEPPFLALVVSGGHTHLVRVVDYGKYEIIVKDGLSTDGSLAKLQTEAAKVDSRIHIYEQPDSSIYDAMNQAVKYANGDYFLFLNAGDSFYDKEVLNKITDAILETSSIPTCIYLPYTYCFSSSFS